MMWVFFLCDKRVTTIESLYPDCVLNDMLSTPWKPEAALAEVLTMNVVDSTGKMMNSVKFTVTNTNE